LSPGNLLLIVRPSHGSPSAVLSAALLEAGCIAAPGGTFEGRIQTATQAALRPLALACAADNAMLILHAEHPRHRQDASYQRLWDRTDEHRAQIMAWRQGEAALPELAPGDLVRL
jgi:hypothetical protein